MAIISIACFALLLVFQGGYYELPSLLFSVVFAVSSLALVRTRELSVDRSRCIIPLGALLLAGFLSCLINGVSSYSLVKLAPYVTLLMSSLFFSCLSSEERNLIVRGLKALGLLSSVIAIVWMLIFPTVNGYVSGGRLQAFFQYANATAVWFASSTVLLLASSDVREKLAASFTFLALLLTRSVSVILLLLVVVTGLLVAKKAARKWLVVFGLAMAFATVAILGRIPEAQQTFLERCIQWMDALRLIGTSPLFGIGPGGWRFAYQTIQSAQYTANVIHGGLFQIMLDCGFIGLLCFAIYIAMSMLRLLKSQSPARREYVAIVILLLAHLAFDIDLAFGFLDVLLAFFLSNPDRQVWSGEGNALRVVVPCALVLLSGSMLFLNIARVMVEADASAPLGIFQNDPEVRFGCVVNLSERGEFQEAIDVAEIPERTNSADLELARSDAYRSMGTSDKAEDVLLDILALEPLNTNLFTSACSRFESFGISEEGKDRLAEIIETANEAIGSFPASLLSNQRTLSYPPE